MRPGALHPSRPLLHALLPDYPLPHHPFNVLCFFSVKMASARVQLKRKLELNDGDIINASAAPCTASNATPAPSAFALLPNELMSSIIELACLRTEFSAPFTCCPSPAADEASHTSSSPGRSTLPRSDLTTAYSLLTVSQHFYTFAAEILYRRIDLHRPSALASLTHTLSQRHQLCQLVKSLHIHGKLLDPIYWLSPVDHRGDARRIMDQIAMPPKLWLRSGLRRPEEEALLPRWCGPGYNYPLWSIPNASPAQTAVFNAVEAVQRCLDINFTGYFSTYKKAQRHPVALWDTLSYEAQAAMDLYLMAMRGWEMYGSYIPYPPLVVTGYPTSPSPAKVAAYPNQPYILSRADLIHHLARPYAESDSFAHPLAFARSGVDILHYRHFCGPRRDEAFWEDLFSPASINPTMPRTATLGSTVALLRSLLQCLGKLEALSITGYLERAVCGPGSPLMPSLHTLCISSLPRDWTAPLRFDALPALKELTMCYGSMRDEEVDNLLVKMPLLMSLKWAVKGSGDG